MQNGGFSTFGVGLCILLGNEINTGTEIGRSFKCVDLIFENVKVGDSLPEAKLKYGAKPLMLLLL